MDKMQKWHKNELINSVPEDGQGMLNILRDSYICSGYYRKDMNPTGCVKVRVRGWQTEEKAYEKI